MKIARRRIKRVAREATLIATVGMFRDACQDLRVTPAEWAIMLPVLREFGFRVYALRDKATGQRRFDLVPLDMR